MSSKVSRFPGTEVTSEDARAHRYLMTRYETELKYSWGSGEAISRFLSGLKEAKIWGRKCKECERTMIPPRMYCERCFRRTDEWVLLKDTGRVATYSVSYVNADASRRDPEDPILVAVVEVDGASPQMGILHLLREVEPESVVVGMKVKAVWRPPQERSGAITDISHFRPFRGGPPRG
jgi:uncharacterized OB-fold protein